MRFIGLLASLIPALALAFAAAVTAAPARPHATFPPHCAPAEVSSLVTRFLAEYNSGAVDDADRFFAPATNQDLLEDAKDGELGFQWYSVSGSIGKRIDGEARNRETLAAYFAVRHGQEERLQLLALSVNYRTWLTHGVGFVFALRRTATDIARPARGRIGLSLGKGGINCPSRTIYVWSGGRYFTAPLTLKRLARIVPCRPRRLNPSRSRPLVCVGQRP